MMIPYVVAFAWDRGSKMKIRLLFVLLLPFFLAGLVFSYSRASWLSVTIAIAVWIIMKLRIRFIHLLLTTVTIVVILFAFWTQILLKLETNKTDSSSNMMKHVESMTNISSDASNVERLNRWYCALEMFKEKPVFGWGPNTYQFKYAPFQIREFRTIISTNSGDWGNAHSEYLGALVSSGLPGLFAFLALIVLILYTGIRLYSRTNDARTRLLSMAAVLSLVTYFVHSFLNNFLDMDNAAIPFWMSFALIVVLDIQERQSQSQQKRPA
jgi:O-antigen ligase